MDLRPALVFGLLASQLSSRALAKTTDGPLAPVSLNRQDAYLLARPCAAGCLLYNGRLPCNVAGYYDLGVELGCGRCVPNNNCYCSAKLASSATSYMSDCVSNACGWSVENWAEEATSMLGIYDGYCATANAGAAAATTTNNPPAAATTTGAGATANPGAASNPGSGIGASQTGSSGSFATAGAGAADSSKKDNKDGLSQSDVVALAASLGVGIPSLLVALITLLVQLRRRKRARGEAAAATTAAAAASSHSNDSTPDVVDEAKAIPVPQQHQLPPQPTQPYYQQYRYPQQQPQAQYTPPPQQGYAPPPTYQYY